MPSFTRNAIKASFLKLLNERPLNQITIKDIVEDCGINRNSFYYHFQDIPTLLEEIVKEDADRILEEHASTSSVEECMEVAVRFALENKRAVMHIYHSANRAMYEKYLIQTCRHVVTEYINMVYGDIPVKEEDKTILIRFYECECFGQIMEWMDDGMRYDICAQFNRICELKKGMAEETFRRSAEGK